MPALLANLKLSRRKANAIAIAEKKEWGNGFQFSTTLQAYL
jgi:hypothetical protein